MGCGHVRAAIPISSKVVLFDVLDDEFLRFAELIVLKKGDYYRRVFGRLDRIERKTFIIDTALDGEIDSVRIRESFEQAIGGRELNFFQKRQDLERFQHVVFF